MWFGNRWVVVLWYLSKVGSWLNKVQKYAKSDTYKAKPGEAGKNKGRE